MPSVPTVPARVVLPLGGLVASYLGWLLTFDLAARPGLFYLFLFSGFSSLFLLARTLDGGAARPALILGIAMLVRLILLPLPPTLSDDVSRYLWDGKVIAAGHNPYVLAPDADELAGLRDRDWSRMAHRDVETVYPPLALSLFSIAARSPFPMPTYKALLSGIDLAGCALLLLVAARAGVLRSRVIWYAWNPLVVLEVAGMGHIDALGVVLVIGTVALLMSQRKLAEERDEEPTASDRGLGKRRLWPVSVAAAAAAGVLAKLVPVVALPMWARQSRRPVRFLAAAGLFLGLGLGPVIVATGGVPPGLVTYGVSWEFNGPVFVPVWRVLDAIAAPDRVKAGLDAAKAWSGHDGVWNRIYPYVYPQFLAKLLLAGCLVVVIASSLRQTEALAGTERLLGGALLLQATVYPWYVLWILPFAALRQSGPWLVLALSIELSYLHDLLSVPLWPWVYLLVWVPFAVAWAWTWRRS